MTRVKFYMDKGGVFAFFPDLIDNQQGDLLSYAHIGQHSACSKSYLKGKRLAAPSEYSDLLRELKGQGYDDLEIIDTRKPISKILEPVNCQYGAPMGRLSIGKFPKDKIVYDRQVILDQGYDRGGAYWGYPNNVWVKFTEDLTFIQFYRD